MQPGRLEADFERWRTAGDLDALAAVFDVVAPDLWRLARHLVRDAAAAEDLVQTTFLEVLAQPGRFRAGAPLMPWLVGILTRQAGKSRRRAARVVDPARIARPDEPAPDVPVAAAEADAVVRSALQRLDEPYASVVRAHLLDGARAVDLAAERQVAAGAIRMQLSRGLAMLRRFLPAGLAVPVVVLRAEAAARVRGEVLAKAAAVSPSITVGWFLCWFPGALLVSKHKLGAAMVAVVALLACLPFAKRLLTSPAAELLPSSANRVQAALPSDAQAAAVGANGAPSATPALRDAVPAVAAPGLWLVGTVRPPRRPRDLPIEPPITIDVVLLGTPAQLRAKVDGEGNYALDLLPLVAPRPPAETGIIRSERAAPFAEQRPLLHVTARHEFLMPVMAMVAVSLPDLATLFGSRHEVRQDFDLRPAAVLHGHVVVPNDDHVAHTKLAAFTTESLRGRVAEPVATMQPDAQGEFAITLGIEGAVELWAFHPRRRPLLLSVVAQFGRRTEVGTVRLEAPWVSVQGRIDLPLDLPGNVLIAARPAAPSAADTVLTTFECLARAGDRLVDTQREAWSDAGGSFVLEGLEAGPCTVRIDSVSMWPMIPADEGIVVVAPAVGVVLASDRVPMRFEVHGANGPLQGADVTIVTGDAHSRLSSGSEGDVQWLGRRDLAYRVTVDEARHESRTFAWTGAELAAGPQRGQLCGKPTAALDVTIVDEVDTGEKHVRLRLLAADGSELAQARERQGVVGSEPLRFEALPAGRFLLRIEPEHTSSLHPSIAGAPTETASSVVDLRPGETVRVMVRRRAVGRLRIDAALETGDAKRAGFQLLDAAGQPVAVRTIMDRPDGWAESKGVLDCRVRNTIVPDLLPGSYTVLVTHASFGTLRRTVDVTAGATAMLRLER
ncbi:MAG: RNA polymerase sigma factor [Planctomycetota bacterium]